MTVVLLRLAGPLQSWGQGSRFRRRDSARYPTKSGVLGLVAAAQGLRRTDPIEHLLALRFGVRVDQPGQFLTDFHTAHTSGPRKPPVVSYRDYLADAVFVAGLEGDLSLIEGIAETLERPRHPLYLGRRACPIEGQLILGLVEEPLATALVNADWQAGPSARHRAATTVPLDVYIDGDDTGRTSAVRDVPLSFSPAGRDYGWRNVVHHQVTVANPDGRRDEGGFMDWFSGMGA
ncbi:MAG: type I-E CRISPR-associated protein Cas5/CasD [Propioniciclava sp.]